MAIFRELIAPLLIVLVFVVALLAVSARIFLPDDMAAPAPIEEDGTQDLISFAHVKRIYDSQQTGYLDYYQYN